MAVVARERNLVRYVEWQKWDWRVHKPSCIDTKKLPTTFLPTFEIDKYRNKADPHVKFLESQGSVKECIFAMERCLAFFEHQHGVQVEGTICDLIENLARYRQHVHACNKARQMLGQRLKT